MESRTPKRNPIPLILSAVALVVAFLVVRWAVINNRHDGAMTPIEAQAMDMTAMAAPPGVHPVGVETVERGSASTTIRVPGSVVALSDEDVVARVSGRVAKVLVYPGDRVKAGQLLAVLDANELGLEAAGARLEGQAGRSRVTIAEREVDRLRAERNAFAAQVAAHAAHEREARANRTTAAAEAAAAKATWDAKAAMVDDRKAELKYAEQRLVREKALFEQGAISRDEYERAVADRDAAASRLRAAEADAEAAKRASEAAQSRVTFADSSIAVAIGEHTASRMQVQAVDESIRKAQAELAVAKADAAAIASGASAADVVADYRNLRALSDGVVSDRVVSPGSLVQPGDAVLRLKVMNQVRVQARVPGRYAGDVREGTRAVITIGDRTRTGAVASVFPTQDSMTRTFTVEVILENPDASLQPGAYVSVELRATSAREGIAVRKEALQVDAAGNHFVWVLQERKVVGETDWTCPMHPEISEDHKTICPICKMDLVPRESQAKFVAARKPVVVGAKTADLAVISSGLTVGDHVIFGGGDDLVEGSPVAPVAWGENGPAELPSGPGHE